MPFSILKKFTTNLKNALSCAANLALQAKNSEIKPIHIFTSLLLQKGSLACEILHKFNLSEEQIKKYFPPPMADLINPILSEESKKDLERSALIAYKFKHRYIGTEHLLYSLIQNKEIAEILEKEKINKDELKHQLVIVLRSTSRFPDITAMFKEIKKHEEKIKHEEMGGKTPETKTPALDFFCVDLTNPKIQVKIDPVIGREEEIERIIHILSRRTKNNPVLIGEAGVGKTAIVEGLAKRIMERKVPMVLLDKKILQLDLSLVVAGTTYRGEFEARFKQIVDELQANPDYLLFIDEIHMIVGAGSAGGGAMDAANIIKPALAKGNIHCIGATTGEDYKKYIESDAALERRFQPVYIEKSTPEESITILKGLRPNYEVFHSVAIDDSALKAAVKLSERYIQDKNLPDKAIDLIDEAAAKAKINLPLDPLMMQIKTLEENLRKLQEEKIKLVQQEKYDEAMRIKMQEAGCKIRLHELKELKAGKKEKYQTRISQNDIAEVIARMTKIPLKDLLQEEKNKLLDLEKTLNQFIIGQKEATKTIADFIRRSQAGLTSPKKPIGSFIFLGPSGVGKTELAKVLARVLFADEKNLLQIDMSEFSQEFNISKLIGAPAGYVGYKEGAILTDFVKHKPYSVILLDEIEKAHPVVFNLLLQILDQGHLTDAMGKRVNFKNTIIIMTSNIGLKSFNEQAEIGFSQDKKITSSFEKVKETVLRALKENFRIEFLNRIDEIIVFNPLTIKDLEEIVVLQLKDLEKRLAEKRIKIKAEKSALRFLAKRSFSPDEGARAIAKIIQELVEAPLAEKILQGKIKPGDTYPIETKVLLGLPKK